jgi:hypothetical protein
VYPFKTSNSFDHVACPAFNKRIRGQILKHGITLQVGAPTVPLAVSLSANFNIMSFHVISCHFMSFHVMSYHVISCHFMLFHFMSFHVISCHFMSFHVISFHFKCHCTFPHCHSLKSGGGSNVFPSHRRQLRCQAECKNAKVRRLQNASAHRRHP